MMKGIIVVMMVLMSLFLSCRTHHYQKPQHGGGIGVMAFATRSTILTTGPTTATTSTITTTITTPAPATFSSSATIGSTTTPGTRNVLWSSTVLHALPRLETTRTTPATAAITTTATTTTPIRSPSSSSLSMSCLDVDNDPFAAAATNSNDPIRNQEREFELHVGKALDTLRQDYPDILTEQPDFTIYDANLEVVDPSGVTVHGLQSYKNAFRLLHALVKVIYCPSRSSITFRMCYDQARRNIRIHWNACVVPREIFGGIRTTLHVDGISVYEMDRVTGNITQHRIEQLLMNSLPVTPKEGVIAALSEESSIHVPSFLQPQQHSALDHQIITSIINNNIQNEEWTVSSSSSSKVSPPSFSVPFQLPSHSNLYPMRIMGPATPRSVLFGDDDHDDLVSKDQSAVAASPTALASDSSSSSSNSNHISTNSAEDGDGKISDDGFDRDAFDRKNLARMKFGLKALTLDEFRELQVAVQQMEQQQLQRFEQQQQQQQQSRTASSTSSSSAAELSKSKADTDGNDQTNGGNFWEKIFSTLSAAVEDTCETNYDCERPEVCCDLGFRKVCCSSGSLVGNNNAVRSRYGEWATIPVVAGPYPPGLGGPQDHSRNNYILHE